MELAEGSEGRIRGDTQCGLMCFSVMADYPDHEVRLPPD